MEILFFFVLFMKNVLWGGGDGWVNSIMGALCFVAVGGWGGCESKFMSDPALVQTRGRVMADEKMTVVAERNEK